jgi:hypothetical protein
MRTCALVILGGFLSMAAFSGVAQEKSMLYSEAQTCAAMESYRKFDVNRYGCAYVKSLGSDIEGIVESAIREAILIRLAQPTVTCPGMQQALDRLKNQGATVSIRLKASLAQLVYENPLLFVEEGFREYVTDGDVFSAIADRVEKTLLASYQ